MKNTTKPRILVLHGPNLNLLGMRETRVYGSTTFETVNEDLRQIAKNEGAEVDIKQSNIEGELVTWIQECAADGILINPGAYGHTSIAIRDALLAVAIPFVEVHCSNTFAREDFRHKSYLADIASGVIIGLGAQSYTLGLKAILTLARTRIEERASQNN
ncbi:MAG: type II 3-dehydroquinate dehydratase [Candidatus Obscuribacterales bacterium]